MIQWLIVPSTDEQTSAGSIGQAFLQRIAVREKARVQAHFLARLYAHPEAQNIVLCGSAALHGVYLHGRWAKDLDFVALPGVAARFADIARECGLTLTAKDEDSVPRLDRAGWTFGLPRAGFPEARIAVEVFTCDTFRVAPERGTWTADSGETLSVWAKPLSEIMGANLGNIFRRAKAADYVDLWLGLQSDPALRYAVREMLGRGLCFAGDFTPPAALDMALALSQLDTLRETWREKLSPYMKHVPPFDAVRADLARSLPFFTNNAK